MISLWTQDPLVCHQAGEYLEYWCIVGDYGQTYRFIITVLDSVDGVDRLAWAYRTLDEPVSCANDAHRVPPRNRLTEGDFTVAQYP